MALAILEFINFDRGHARFSIDTGTNPFYRIKIGKSITENNGFKWVDEVTHATAMQNSSMGNYLLNTTKEVAVPSNFFDRESCYAQLFSFKNSSGKSPAFSKVIKVPVGFKNAVKGDYLLSLSINSNDMSSEEFNDCRMIAHKNGADYAIQESFLDDLLGGIKLAAPVVLQVLSAIQDSSGGASNGQNSGGGAAGFLNTLLNSLLHGVSGGAAVNSQVSTGKSYDGPESGGNRFVNGSNEEFSHPFIFGIDDALLASLAGPLIQQGVQLIPQLLNAQNQQKLQSQVATNKLMTDLVAATNQRMLLQQLLANQQHPASQPAVPTDPAQLIALLQAAQAQAVTQPAPATPTPVSNTQSIGAYTGLSAVLSVAATIVFDAGTQTSWNGTKKSVYSKNGPVTFKIKLNVPDPAPKTPLPKAIFKFYLKETDSQKSVFEKTFKQKNISANTSMDFAFTKDELGAIPVNKSLMLFCEMRWLTQSNKEVKALGSTEVIFVNNYFLKEQGKTVSDERELTDMKVYRSFWNKIWEAPVLDAVNKNADGNKKYMWSLDGNLKYTFSITADHDSNGLMETKMLKAKGDSESLTERTEGRMKAGLELSIVELNKLSTLWDKQKILPDDKLEALKNVSFAKNNISEFIYNVKLKGKAGERGMVWVIPVLKLLSVTLNKVKTTNETGQVVAIEEEIVQFPIPVAARVIGLKSA